MRQKDLPLVIEKAFPVDDGAKPKVIDIWGVKVIGKEMLKFVHPFQLPKKYGGSAQGFESEKDFSPESLGTKIKHE